MTIELFLLMAEAVAVYLLVLGTHSLRSRFGPAPFHALLGCITAVMSWITDAGVTVAVGGVTFVVGSTVFYTSLLLGVFVVYVFDGPRATRIAISTVAGVSALTPVIAFVLHLQMKMVGHARLEYVPVPSLRINTASVAATIADLLFLAMVWEFLGSRKLRLGLGLRAFFTLLGVMWLDVLLFATGAFAGGADYLNIMKGTFLTRFIIAVFAWPVLYLYLHWQNRRPDVRIEDRPILAILREVAHVRNELSTAQREIERRKAVERENAALIEKLRATVSRVTKLEGLLPVCAGCGLVRAESAEEGNEERWVPLEEYLRERTAARFSHGLCAACVQRLYPDVPQDKPAPPSGAPRET